MNDANDVSSQKTQKKRTVLSCLSSTKKKKRRTLRKGERCSRVASCERETRPSSGYDFPRAKVFLIRFRWNTARDEAREDDSGAHEQSAKDAAEILSLSLSLSLSSGILFARDFVRVNVDDAAAL